MNGQIVRLMADKGFGFIKAEDRKEYFFHRSSLEKTIRFDMLREGQRVKFKPLSGTKGPRAEDVVLEI